MDDETRDYVRHQREWLQKRDRTATYATNAAMFVPFVALLSWDAYAHSLYMEWLVVLIETVIMVAFALAAWMSHAATKRLEASWPQPPGADR
jgi:hypothetical protein